MKSLVSFFRMVALFFTITKQKSILSILKIKKKKRRRAELSKYTQEEQKRKEKKEKRRRRKRTDRRKRRKEDKTRQDKTRQDKTREMRVAWFASAHCFGKTHVGGVAASGSAAALSVGPCCCEKGRQKKGVAESDGRQEVVAFDAGRVGPERWREGDAASVEGSA